jgi:hypothetical protein
LIYLYFSKKILSSTYRDCDISTTLFARHPSPVTLEVSKIFIVLLPGAGRESTSEKPSWLCVQLRELDSYRANTAGVTGANSEYGCLHIHKEHHGYFLLLVKMFLSGYSP